MVEIKQEFLPDFEPSLLVQSNLANRLYKRGVHHWDPAFRMAHNTKGWLVNSLGSAHLNNLYIFQRFLFGEQQKAVRNPMQEVVLIPKLIGTSELPIIVNGAPILLVHPSMRFTMENLLNGGFEYENRLKGLSLSGSDVEEDVNFFNNHFKLGLELVRVSEDDRLRISLKIPEKTRVIITTA